MKDKFLDQVEKQATEEGCWIWRGTRFSHGRYGFFYENHKKFSAHRYAYLRFNGEIPDGMVICHRCDNGLCVNPKHLFIGTLSDNSKDAYRKGRLPLLKKSQQGELNHSAKLDKPKVREIREFYQSTPVAYRELARVFGLKSPGHARSIVVRDIWNYQDC